MAKNPLAFMSYVQLDDKHESGRLSEFRERLSSEVRMHTGEDFPIFQDRNDIKWGQQWEERIEKSIDAVTFLIPIITPSFFKSPACRKEMEHFLKREKTLKRNDLILPVYYLDAPVLNDEKMREKDKLAKIIAKRQYADWRELRFELFTLPEVGKAMARLAVDIRDALGERAAPQTKKKSTVSKLRGSKGEIEELRGKAGEEVGLPEVAETVSAARDRPGPAAKSEPPICIVDPMHRGDHATISAAIRDAEPGDRIIVRPGLYDEAIVIEKPLEIIGEGGPSEVVIQAKGAGAIIFKTTMGRVANLTIRQMGGGRFFGVNISQGRLILEDCDITSQSLACIAIHGGADPVLRRNRIHDGKQSGVYVYESGLGTLRTTTSSVTPCLV